MMTELLKTAIANAAAAPGGRDLWLIQDGATVPTVEEVLPLLRRLGTTEAFNVLANWTYDDFESNAESRWNFWAGYFHFEGYHIGIHIIEDGAVSYTFGTGDDTRLIFDPCLGGGCLDGAIWEDMELYSGHHPSADITKRTAEEK